MYMSIKEIPRVAHQIHQTLLFKFHMFQRFCNCPGYISTPTPSVESSSSAHTSSLPFSFVCSVRWFLQPRSTHASCLCPRRRFLFCRSFFSTEHSVAQIWRPAVGLKFQARMSILVICPTRPYPDSAGRQWGPAPLLEADPLSGAHAHGKLASCNVITQTVSHPESTCLALLTTFASNFVLLFLFLHRSEELHSSFFSNQGEMMTLTSKWSQTITETEVRQYMEGGGVAGRCLIRKSSYFISISLIFHSPHLKISIFHSQIKEICSNKESWISSCILIFSHKLILSL